MSIWHLLHNAKSAVKISSIIVAILENMNFKSHQFFDPSPLKDFDVVYGCPLPSVPQYACPYVN